MSTNRSSEIHPDTGALAELFNDLAEAERRLDAATRHLALAHSEESDAVNAINAIQKRIDKVIAARRQAAPPRSDWARSTADADHETP